jgi:hypothetical protein
MNINVKDLNVGEGFYLPNSDYKGTQPHAMYAVVEICEDGIFAQGNIETCSGNIHNSVFWLPNFTQVEHLNLEFLLAGID